MTAQETNKILAMIVEVYPKFNEGRNPQITSRLWSSLFQDEPYEWVEKGLMAFIATDTKGFAPTPGAIKEKIAMLIGSEERTEVEAWGLVLKALHNSAYNSRSEFNKLPKDVQEVIGCPEQLFDWSQLEVAEVNTVIASNFQRSYRARSESRKTAIRLPESLKISLPKTEAEALPEPEQSVEDYEYTEMPQSFRDVAEKIFGRA